MQYRFRGGRYRRTWASALSAGVLLTAVAVPGTSRADLLSDKSDRFISTAQASRSQQGWSSVIVKVSGGDFTAEQTAQVRSLGGYVYRHLGLIDAAAVRIPNRSLSCLAAQSWVERLSADVAVIKNDEFTVGRSGAGIAYSKYGLTGYGVGVAVIDSGIRPHYDLTTPGLLGTSLLSNTRIVKSVNFVSGTTSTNDAAGHGTHVAGIIAGNGHSSSGLTDFRTFYGIARKAKLVNVRVLDGQGRGDVSSVISGIQWVVNNKSKFNIRVINLSLGHPVGESYTTDPLCLAVEQAWKSGIVVVCAAGNVGRGQDMPDPALDNEGFGTAYGSIQSPANSPYAITVGATKASSSGRAYDRIATYSSRGPSRLDMVIKPDIIAPGNQVISLQSDGSMLDEEHSPTNQVKWGEYRLSLLGGNSNKYFRLSGTSMAAPVVAGAAALLLQKYPKLTPDTVKARLMLSADKWAFPDGSTDPLTFGAGYLNIPAALVNTMVVPSGEYAVSPTLVAGDDGNLYVNMDRAIWGRASLWGTGVTDLRAIWGRASLEEDSFNTVSDTRAIWGRAYEVQMDRAIWGRASSGAVDLSSKALYGEP